MGYAIMKKIRTVRKAVLAILLFLLVQASPVFAQTVVPSGRTATTVTTVGTTSTITTSTIQGQNAFNHFTRFDVPQNQAANMVLPANTQTLINVVNGPQSVIAGTMTALKNGVVGGNLVLVNPSGVFVTGTGAVNAERIALLTPTTAFADKIVSSTGVVDTQTVNDLLSGNFPTSNVSITNTGQLNALQGINIKAYNVINNNHIATGNRAYANMSQFVNLQGFLPAQSVVKNGQFIEIVASNEYINRGDLTTEQGKITTGGYSWLEEGVITGDYTIVSNQFDTFNAEIMLGNFINNLIVNGNLTAIATNGNIYYYGGLVDGNLSLKAGQTNPFSIAIALGRFRDLLVTGDVDLQTPGNVSLFEGVIKGDTRIIAGESVGIFDTVLEGDLFSQSTNFALLGGRVLGELRVIASGDKFIGTGGLLKTTNTLNVYQPRQKMSYMNVPTTTNAEAVYRTYTAASDTPFMEEDQAFASVVNVEAD